jgi:regulatory protein
MDKKVSVKWNEENARANIEKYCAYQERSHDEVRYKLISHGIYGDFLEELISHLIENNFLNEERFAVQFAGGKFRIKKWGRLKIVAALKAKGVSAYSIRVALEQIPEDAYKAAITYWIEKRGGFTTDSAFEDKMTLVRYLMSKGFESEAIEKCLGEN